MSTRIEFNRRFWLGYALAWTPYAISYVAVFISQSNLGITTQLVSMARNIIPAALLGIGVLLFCNRVTWASHKKLWFFPVHLVLSLVYSTVWAFVLFFLLTLGTYWASGQWNWFLFFGNALQWQIFTGIMIYATIASVAYVIQAVQNLREEERRAARAETLYAQNALAALQAQLNPHFLFNTLHSLMALVRYNPEHAETALEKLAEMLRYSLREKRESRNHMVRLADELEFIDNYLDLEKLRLGDRLEVIKEIDETALNALLPAFTIQPLVENSIKHGVAPRSGAATVRIFAETDNGDLRIRVQDNGKGARQSELSVSEGMGLNLIREQLQIQYGESQSFEISTEPGEGFLTKISFPMTVSEKAKE